MNMINHDQSQLIVIVRDWSTAALDSFFGLTALEKHQLVSLNINCSAERSFIGKSMYLYSPYLLFPIIVSPTFEKAMVPNRFDDYFSVNSSHLALSQTTLPSPHSLELMSCKKSINMNHNAHFRSILPQYSRYSWFLSPSHSTQSFLPRIPLLSVSFFFPSSLSFSASPSPSIISYHCCADTRKLIFLLFFLPVCLYAAMHGTI